MATAIAQAAANPEVPTSNFVDNQRTGCHRNAETIENSEKSRAIAGATAGQAASWGASINQSATEMIPATNEVNQAVRMIDESKFCIA
ncbi:MAG: hypothetical protein AAGA30_07745 [Planctomycetota bacterium]